MGEAGLILSAEIGPENAHAAIDAVRAAGARATWEPVQTQEEMARTLAGRHPSFLFADFLPSESVPTSVRWIQLMSSGVDQERASRVWEQPSVAVTTASGILSPAMAQFVMAAILYSAHRFDRLADFRATRDWGLRWDFVGRLLVGTTVAILGYGGVGQAVAGLARAFGMEVTAIRRSAAGRPRFSLSGVTRPGDEGIEVGTLDELDRVLANADFVVCALPLTDETRRIIDGRRIAAMKPGVVIVNVSRGAVIDEAALGVALGTGHVGHAFVDVFDQEPLPRNSPLWDVPRLILTPHVSGVHDRVGELAVRLFKENLRRFLAGEPLMNRVDAQAGY